LTLETSLPDGCTQTNVPSQFTFPGTNPFVSVQRDAS
jgi:hypothetical protein